MAKYKVLTSFFVGQNKELPEKNIPPPPLPPPPQKK